MDLHANYASGGDGGEGEAPGDSGPSGPLGKDVPPPFFFVISQTITPKTTMPKIIQK